MTPRRTTLTLASIVSLLLLFEVTLRFGLGMGKPVLVVPDAACEYTLKPDQHLKRFGSRIDINSMGMRSAEFSPAKDPHTLRILFVGDSLTYGTSRVDQNDLFTQILRRELPQRIGRPVEVLNASAGSWAIDNELSFLSSRGTFGSDVVILIVNSDDLFQPRATLQEFSDTLLIHSYATATGELIERFVWPRVRGLAFPHPPAKLASDAQTQAANLEKMREIKQIADRGGSNFVLVFLPFRTDIPTTHAGDTFKEWAASNSVPFLDLTAAESTHSVGEISFDHGMHFNTRGNRIIANAFEQQWPALLPRTSP